MRLDYKSPEALAPIIEALLFASDEPQSAVTLRALILGDDLNKIAAEEAELEKQEAEQDAAAQSSEIVGTEEPDEDENADGDETNTAEQPSAETDSAGSDIAAPVAHDAVAHDAVAAGPTEEQFAQSAAQAAVENSAESAPAGVQTVPEKKRKKRQLIELVTLHVAVQHLNSLYEQDGRAFRIVEIAGGYQFATRAEYSEYVARLSKEKSRRRLSGASLETLAIVAYKQPVSKIDIENIRGVNCDEVLKSLLEKNLVTITGRAEAVGRPLLYGTTTDFLRHFGLHDLSDLPRPREIEELMKEEAVRATTLEEAASEFTPDGEETEGMTIDAAVAVARELGEIEESRVPHAIELDEESFANPGHGEAEEAKAEEANAGEANAEDVEADESEMEEIDAESDDDDALDAEGEEEAIGTEVIEAEIEVITEDSEEAE